MHPIERLRYVARAGQAADRVLVAESVPAFAAFAKSPGALLVSLRQLISRQPASPGLLVLGARMLASLDPLTTAWEFVDELELDATDLHAAELHQHESGGIELIETQASGPEQFLCPPGAAQWIAEARERGRTVAAVTPHGSRLPRMLWKGYLERSRRGEVGALSELIAHDQIDEIVGPEGVQRALLWTADCSDVAELSNF